MMWGFSAVTCLVGGIAERHNADANLHANYELVVVLSCCYTSHGFVCTLGGFLCRKETKIGFTILSCFISFCFSLLHAGILLALNVVVT